MAERAADHEWRGDGEAAELVVYAPDAATAERAFGQTLPASNLPGVAGPVHAVASGEDLGWVAASETHAAPDLFSAPGRGLLLVVGASAASLGVTPGEVGDLALRGIPGVALPRPGEAGVRRAGEAGALWAAEEGLIPEEDLAFFGVREDGEPDALPRRALSAGARDFDRGWRVSSYEISEVPDTDRAETLGLGSGTLILHAGTYPEDLGRLAFAAHRKRILTRVWSEDFGATAELPAAPLETGEAADLLAATRAVANYADARAALLLYALRRALDAEIELRAAWRPGGLAEAGGTLLHRHNLAAAGNGDALVVGGSVAVGTGAMRGSVPTFGPGPGGGGWAWEEAGLLERVAVSGSVG